MLSDLLVAQTQRVRECRLRVYDESAVLVMAREVRGTLAAAVGHEHRGVAERSGECGRGGVGHVMRHEPEDLGVEPGQRGRQEAWRTLRVPGTQPLPFRVGARLPLGDERGS